MKKTIIILSILTLFISCGSVQSFQSFFNQHKNDIGATSFQVPNFMKALLGSISPEMGGILNNIQDLKFITFKDITSEKQLQLIKNINAVTAIKYTDILRQNMPDKTKIVSVIEDGDIVKKAIIFNSTLSKTSVFYLQGKFDPNKLKSLSETNQFDDLSSKLLQQYQSPITPGFNPNN